MLYCAVLSAQLCPTLCYAMDCSPPGSSVHGILQARIPEWVAISYSILLGPFRKSQKARGGEEINN